MAKEGSSSPARRNWIAPVLEEAVNPGTVSKKGHWEAGMPLIRPYGPKGSMSPKRGEPSSPLEDHPKVT